VKRKVGNKERERKE
jgi:hypothetical protein